MRTGSELERLPLVAVLLAFAFAGCVSPAKPSDGVSASAPSPAPSTPAGWPTADVPGITPSALAVPSDEPTESPTPIPTVPPVLAQLKTIDASKYRVKALTPAPSPYSWAMVSGKAILRYDVNGLKGSVPIPLTTTELAATRESDVVEAGPWFLGAADHFVVFMAGRQIAPKNGGIPCGLPPQELWRMLVAPLDSQGKPGDFTVLDSGKSTVFVVWPGLHYGEGSDCAHLYWPKPVISGDLLAYAIPAPTADHPFASQIVVRSLLDGSVQRRLDISESVFRLQMSGGNLVWMQFQGEYRGNPDRSLPLFISAPDKPEPRALMTFQIDPDLEVFDAPAFFLSNNILTWDGFSTGKVWKQDLATPAPTQTSPAGSFCRLQDSDGNYAIMNCSGEWLDRAQVDDDGNSPASWLVLASPAGYQRVTGLSGTGGWAECVLRAGKVQITDWDGSGAAFYYEIPLP